MNYWMTDELMEAVIRNSIETLAIGVCLTANAEQSSEVERLCR